MWPHRRDFLARSAAVGSALLASATTQAIDPIVRPAMPKMRLSLAAYSFRQWLDLKKKPRPDWTLDDFIDFAAEQKIDAVELTAYYFADTSSETLAKLKSRCAKAGLVVSGTAVGNNFCVSDLKQWKEQIALVKAWTERTAALGGKTLRIFAGNTPKGDTEDNARARCIEAIHEVCEFAAKHQVYMALENHGGITGTAEQLLKIVAAVKHPWFGVNLDTGNFRTPDPYADLEKVVPYAVTVQLKTEIFPQGKPKQEADLSRLIDMLRKAKYDGFVALEYEAAEDAKVAVPRYLQQLKRLLSA